MNVETGEEAGPSPLTTTLLDVPRPWAGRRPKVLLATVFKPFNVVDEYNAPGNIYEMGVFHRSFTKRQGFFTMQQVQHTYPLHLMAHNLEADCTLLEFPSLEEFVAEARRGFDVVGINCMVSTLKKARRMCAEVKRVSPATVTVIGGGGSLGIPELMDPFSDHVCKGDGVTWMRAFLGQDPLAPFRFPITRLHYENHGLLGLPLKDHNYPVALGLGCPNQCEFCSTSAQFGGRYTPFFESGKDLFAFMQAVDRKVARTGEKLDYISFMVYDENMLLNFPFVEELRELNRKQALERPQYLMFGFADATVLSRYSPDDLLELGLETIWVGIESPSTTRLDKVSDVDVRRLIEDLASSGIKVIGSLIAGLEDHTEDTIRQDMAFALTLRTTGIQYMPVNPIPGTASWIRLKEKGMIPHRDPNFFNMSHYNVVHPTLTEEKVQALLQGFFDEEHRTGGPLVYRFLLARFQGWQKYHAHANPYLRGRSRVFEGDLLKAYPVLLIGEGLAPSDGTRALFRDLRREVEVAFRWSDVVRQTALGCRPASQGGVYALLSAPPLREGWRRLFLANALLKDPRNHGWRDLLFHRREAIERSGQGTVPWGQPATIVTRYPQEEA